jgi:mitogen-activated protein kinase kinase kinase
VDSLTSGSAGIAVQHPPLPEPGQLSEEGIEFLRQCLNVDPEVRPTAQELMSHPWIMNAQMALANFGEEEDQGDPGWVGMQSLDSSRTGVDSIGSNMTVPLLEEEEEEEEMPEGGESSASALAAVQEQEERL